jgi:hypothetical protein
VADVRALLGTFLNEVSITGLIGAVLPEQNDNWLVQRRYLRIERTAELTSLLIDDDLGNFHPWRPDRWPPLR